MAFKNKTEVYFSKIFIYSCLVISIHAATSLCKRCGVSASEKNSVKQFRIPPHMTPGGMKSPNPYSRHVRHLPPLPNRRNGGQISLTPNLHNRNIGHFPPPLDRRNGGQISPTPNLHNRNIRHFPPPPRRENGGQISATPNPHSRNIQHFPSLPRTRNSGQILLASNMKSGRQNASTPVRGYSPTSDNAIISTTHNKRHIQPLAEKRYDNSTRMANKAGTPNTNQRNSINQETKPFSNTARKAIGVPRILKQRNLNATKKWLPANAAIIPPVSNRTNLNSNNKYFPGKVTVVPAVINRTNLNANNKSSSGKVATIPVVFNRTNLNSNNKTLPGKVGVIPSLLNQTNLNANDKTLPEKNATKESQLKLAETFPILFPSKKSSNWKGSKQYAIKSATDDKESLIWKNLVEDMKKTDENFFTYDYGTPIANKGSHLKLFGGIIRNSIICCLVAILITYCGSRIKI